MGYRSEVAIVIGEDDFNELKRNDKVRELLKCAEIIRYLNSSQNIISIYWDWIKWYETYEDVNIIENFLDNLQEKEHSYHFVRVGEELEDIEERYYEGENDELETWDYVGISRQVEFYLPEGEQIEI